MRLKPSYQPGSSLTLVAGDVARAMVGAWFLSSPGIGGRVHNYSPLLSALTQGSAVAHGIVQQPYASSGWRLQAGCVSLETSDNAAEGTGTWVDLGDPIATADDVSVLVGWIPNATTVPSGTEPGALFNRGADGAGAGWSIGARHTNTDEVSFQITRTSPGTATDAATMTSAGIRPGRPNYICGTYRQGSKLAVAFNGRMGPTVAPGSNLRTSTRGCAMGRRLSSTNTSHCEGLLFSVLWRRAMSDAEIMYLSGYPWVLWTVPDLTSDPRAIVPGELAGQIIISLGLSGSMDTDIRMAGTIPITVGPSGALTTSITMAAQIPINVGLAADLKAAKLAKGLKNCGHPMFTNCERLHLGEES